MTGNAESPVQKPKNKRPVLKAVLAVVALLIVVGLFASASQPQKNTSANTKSTSNHSSSGGSSSEPITLTPQQQAQLNSANTQPQTLLDISGSGQRQTQSFTTTGNWHITYTYDCSNFGMQGNFQYYIYNTDGTLTSDTGANDLGMSGGTTNYYYNSGTYYISVNSECNWHITVVQ